MRVYVDLSIVLLVVYAILKGEIGKLDEITRLMEECTDRTFASLRRHVGVREGRGAGGQALGPL